MQGDSRCAECGQVISTGCPGGFCPQCLLRLGLGNAENESETNADAQEKIIGLAAQPTAKAGDRIGHYLLLREIGHGGCGVVYLAEQEEPVRRKVALKVIKLGMDAREVVTRFEAERQALALMDHPNIAKVLDAGAVGTSAESQIDHGRPYFVMELVDGPKITDYCDQHQFSTQQRLELFVQVCHAVQHAHQKGIIHRDLKPSNVLVATHDGKAVPKVIDFGIAKATQGRLTDETFFTAFEQFLGTPAYMSPEQADLGGLDIDTRSDIYSLGVLLYELLAGKTPFDAKELVAAGLEAMRRTIQEKDPPKPSTRISTLEALEQTAIAQRRRADVRRLVDLTRGDLDWIVMKCLEKDRTRRYETANGLASDLERHLRHEPVLAGPPSQVYRLQKWVRRNKLVCGAAAAILIVLLLGVAVSTTQAVRAAQAERDQSRSRQQAEAAQANEARERTQAQIEAAKSEQVAGFLKDMLRGVGPSRALGRDTTMLREILDKTAERVGQTLTNQPEVEIELRRILAETYDDLGLYGQADKMASETLNRVRSHFGEDTIVLAEVLDRCGRNKLEEVVELWRERLDLMRPQMPDDDKQLADVLEPLSSALLSQKKFAEAELPARECLAIREKQLPDDPLTFRTRSLLGASLLGQKKYREAEPLLLSGYEGMRKREARIPSQGNRSLQTALEYLVRLYQGTGQTDRAREWKMKLEETKRASTKRPPAPATESSHLSEPP